MRVMTILGSPRRQGNTAKVLVWIEEALRTAGHEVDSVNVLDYQVRGCSECLACMEKRTELCSIADDGNPLFRRMVAADLVLVAAPVFCWGFPAQIKGLIDRLCCMMDSDGRRPGVPRLYDKPMALLLTSGGDETDNADLVIRGFEHIVAFLQARMVGYLLIGGYTLADKKQIEDTARTRAIEFAKMLDLSVGSTSPSS